MRILFLCITLTLSSIGFSQLYIGAGSLLQMNGNVQLSLADMSFVNHGSFSAGNSLVYFSGVTNSFISGTSPIQYYSIQVSKSPPNSLSMQRNIGVSGTVQFSGGMINLNGFDLDLGTTGVLISETESSRITGVSGGEIVLTTSLNAPSSANPGNLGALISSTQNLGSVTIRRGHKPYSITGNNTVTRYYQITPANNSGLSATLRFQYLDAELNGLTESTLGMWRSVDATTWTYQNFNGRDVIQNYVEKTGIDAFSFWALSTQSPTLPVIMSAFSLQCDGSKIKLQWKTSQEINTSHFIIERNTGNNWSAIGRLNASGNSSVEKSYEFIDDIPVAQAQYRIAQYDMDGRVRYTSIVVSDCSATEILQAWPVPFKQSFTVRIGSNRTVSASVRVVDARGMVVLKRQVNLLNGINQFDVDLNNAATGVYVLIMDGISDLPVKAIRLIKE